MKMIVEEFIINEFLTLKLEWVEGKKAYETVIYIANEQFIQCKHLFLTIPKGEICTKINSIDDAAFLYKSSKNQFHLNPKEEFWGHCSNLQAWAENDYDTRLLHSNLSLPLLKKLKEAGDPKANFVYKREIYKHFKKMPKDIKQELMDDYYLDDFSKDELLELLLIPSHQLIAKRIEREYGKSVLNIHNIGDEKIVSLEINGNIPNSMRELSNSLISLILTKVEIPKWIGEFKRLEQLTIENCLSKEIPDSIGNLTALKRLKIIYPSRLETLTNSIQSLENLEKLIINDTQIKFVPNSVCKLVRLKELVLVNNKICKIPKCLLGNLKELEDLIINSNELISLPDSFNNKRLRYLRIDGNPIQIIPNSLKEIKSLVSFWASKTTIERNREIIKEMKKRGITITSKPS